MAFLESGWGKTSVTLNQPIYTLENAVVVGSPTGYTYQSSTDNIATIGAADYFVSKHFELSVGDYIFVKGSDASQFMSVTAITQSPPSVTTSALSAAGAVGTANLDNLAVTTAKIDNLAVTTGKLADDSVTSAKLDPTVMQYVMVPMTAAEFLGMYAAPKLLIAAAGANTLIRVHLVTLEIDYGTAQFAAGGTVGLQYSATANGLGSQASATVASAIINGRTADSAIGLNAAGPIADAADVVNEGVYLSNATAAFTTGDSTVDVHVWYTVTPTSF